MSKISLLPEQHKSGWNLKQHFEKYRGVRSPEQVRSLEQVSAADAALPGVADAALPGLAASGVGVPGAVVAGAVSQHTEMYPTTDGITPDLPEPDWDAVAAQLAEKTRLAAYDETEIKQLREIYPPETAAALLRPAYTLRERIALLPRGVLVLMAALLSTVIGLGVWVASTQLTTPAAEGQGTAVPADSGGVSAGFAAPGEFTEQQGTAAANGGAAGGAAAGSASTPEIVVHVVGEVHQPGVYTLPAGSRITAALEQAGGATPAAAVEALNLARVLVDGEKITVPSAAQVAEGWVAADAAGGGAGGGSTTGNSPGKINLNTATVQQLEQLPKIGAVTAANIVAWRDAHGGFQSVEQLLEVGGIGEKTLTLLREHVTL